MSNLYFTLAGWEALEIRGPDAKDFLNRLTSADFKNLKPGSYTAAALLQHTGKVTLYFKSLFAEEGVYLNLVPGKADEACEILEKLHFRENLKITPCPGQWVYVRVLGAGPEPLDALRGLGDDAFVFSEGRWNRSLWEDEAPFSFDLGLVVRARAAASTTRALEEAGFEKSANEEAFRIRAADPGVPREINGSILVLEAGLDGDAVHENKGCYPGQEVVERIHAMGQVPRKLASFRGEGAPPDLSTGPLKAYLAQTGTEAGDAGVLTSAAPDPLAPPGAPRWVGLGFIKRLYAKPDSAFTISGEPVQVRFKT